LKVEDRMPPISGGLMQLVSFGAQDTYLTGNPQINFFKTVYPRTEFFSKRKVKPIKSLTEMALDALTQKDKMYVYENCKDQFWNYKDFFEDIEKERRKKCKEIARCVMNAFHDSTGRLANLAKSIRKANLYSKQRDHRVFKRKRNNAAYQTFSL